MNRFENSRFGGVLFGLAGIALFIYAVASLITGLIWID